MKFPQFTTTEEGDLAIITGYREVGEGDQECTFIAENHHSLYPLKGYIFNNEVGTPASWTKEGKYSILVPDHRLNLCLPSLSEEAFSSFFREQKQSPIKIEIKVSVVIIKP